MKDEALKMIGKQDEKTEMIYKKRGKTTVLNPEINAHGGEIVEIWQKRK